MNALRDILFRPRRAAERLCAQPSWLGPFLLLALLSAVLYALGSEGRIDELIRHLPPSADETARSQVRENLRADLWRNTLFLPYRLALGWGGFAALLFMSGRALSHERATTYRHVFALETHAELILLFPSLLPLVGLPLPSLSLIAGSAPFFADSLLRAANCFTLWYILALSAGMAVLFELRTRTAFLVVAVCWGMTESLNIGILHLLTRSFHFYL